MVWARDPKTVGNAVAPTEIEVVDVGTEIAPERLGPPRGLLLLAVASVASSAALLAFSGLPVHVAGYALASVLTIVLVGMFHRADLVRRQLPFYLPSRAASRCAGALAVLGVLVAALHTWPIATVLAK